jgi:acyl-CoA reductase-like NAD-dependent aldehyde dehydrogenase
MSGAGRGALAGPGGGESSARDGPADRADHRQTGALKPIAERLQVNEVVARLEVRGLAREPCSSRCRALERPGVAGSSATLASGVVVRDPVGVVARISPFNFPLTNCAGKIGPALACGNTVVIKPPPLDPLGVAELARIVGSVLPPGVVNFVCGSGPEIGAALTESPDVDMIPFTGSSMVGRKIEEAAGRTLKRTLMELGGKSANIVFADADLTKALGTAMSVWTFHPGQISIAPTPLLIEDSVYDDFTAHGAAARGSRSVIRTRPASSSGRWCRARSVTLASALRRDRRRSATVACGGKRPTARRAASTTSRPCSPGEQRDDDRARGDLRTGDHRDPLPRRGRRDPHRQRLEFGLYGYVWTGDTSRGLRVARHAHRREINGSPPNPDAPFGGFKMSGIGRDGGRFALATYSELKVRRLGELKRR